MNRRNLIKSLAGITTIGNAFASQTKEKTYFNYLDIIGNQIFPTDYPYTKCTVYYDTPLFLVYKYTGDGKLGVGLYKSENSKIFQTKNDANKFVSELIDKQKTDTLFSKYILSEYVDRRAATLVFNSNRMAILNRRGPSNGIITSSDIQHNVEYAIQGDSYGALVRHFGPSVHVNENRSNTIEMFYKGAEKWDTPLAYKILPSGEVEVHISPDFEKSIRKVQVV